MADINESQFFLEKKNSIFPESVWLFLQHYFFHFIWKEIKYKNWQTQEWLFELTSFWIMTLRKISIGKCKYKYFPHEKIQEMAESPNNIFCNHENILVHLSSGRHFLRKASFVLFQNWCLTYQFKIDVIFSQKLLFMHAYVLDFGS